MSNTNEILLNALPHIDAHISRYPDGTFAAYELYPRSGYVIHDPTGDYGADAPYYSKGGMSIINENYNWVDNPDGYEAVLISELQ